MPSIAKEQPVSMLCFFSFSNLEDRMQHTLLRTLPERTAGRNDRIKEGL